MIKETLEGNGNKQKQMISKFIRRTRKASVQKRGRAIKTFNKKFSKLRRKAKAMMRIEYAEKKRLADKMSKV